MFPVDAGDRANPRPETEVGETGVGLQARTTTELPLDIAAQSSTPPFAVGTGVGPDRAWIRRGLAVGQSFQAHPWLGRIGQTMLVLLTIGAVVTAWRTRAVETEAGPGEAIEIEAETGPVGGLATGPGEVTQPTTTTEAPSAQLPVGNQVVNGGFEQPQVSDGAFAFLEIPGWFSSDGDLEIWSGHRGVNAFQGRQFIELNARQPLTITQVVSVRPGFQYRWSVAHRGRDDDDTIEVLINNNLVATITSSPDRWRNTEGLIDVPQGQNRVIITLRAVDEGSTGNLVDEVSLIAVAPLP